MNCRSATWKAWRIRSSLSPSRRNSFGGTEFNLRWDPTKNIHETFQSGTFTPRWKSLYTPVNKDLYPTDIRHGKDSVWTSIKHLGTPLDYNQSFLTLLQNAAQPHPHLRLGDHRCQLQLVVQEWIRGTDLEDGNIDGNTVSNNRQLNINGTFNMENSTIMPFSRKTKSTGSKKDSRTSSQSRNKKKPVKKTGDKGNRTKNRPLPPTTRRTRKGTAQEQEEFREGSDADARYCHQGEPRKTLEVRLIVLRRKPRMENSSN